MSILLFFSIYPIIAGLVISLFVKMQRLKKLSGQVSTLSASLEQMDEQAKLIMRTDMELNKTQEELDKKIAGLNTLQKLSREMGTALEEEQIFQRINNKHLEDLGFDTALAFLWKNLEKEFKLYLNIGYSEDDSGKIKATINQDKNFYLNLISHDQTASSTSIPDGFLPKDKICKLFLIRSFIICPILTQEGDQGFIFVGTHDNDMYITEGDRELISVLANQIGQTLDNARLFEKNWKSQQALEGKVEERTHQLTQTMNELIKISKRKSDFISSVSHELRTPLTSIKGYAAILLTGKLGTVPDEIKERLEKINRHSDELVHMVNDLLDISRIESGKANMKIETLELIPIIDKIADLLVEQFQNKKISFKSTIPNDCHTILADRGQLERIFINLLGNAIKFTPEKGSISITAQRVNNTIQINITDTGFGIPKEDQENIFEEFYRVDNAINQEVKGTGLGLTLIKHIIEAHKGKIWVKSILNEGSTFSFTLTTGE